MSLLAEAFRGAKALDGQTAKRLNVAPAKRVAAPTPLQREPLGLQGTAKSKHPEFRPVTIYIRKETHKRAGRKFEDAQGGDFSDLVQQLLEKYLGGEL
jgi:hypothetical protein